jgi:hypothetical protein
MATKKLHKTTIVIWSEEDEDPSNLSLAQLAREADTGSSYCSHKLTELVENPEKDPYWDGTEFFSVDDDTEVSVD